MFVPIIFAGPNGYGTAYRPNNASTGATTEYDSLDKAKKGVAEMLASSSYKASFNNGYDAVVLDMDKGTVASRAKVEAPSLNWKDAS